MRFDDDQQVIVMLFRNPNMKTLSRTFSMFCQWCGGQRTPIRTETPEHQVLMCAVCDEGDE